MRLFVNKKKVLKLNANLLITKRIFTWQSKVFLGSRAPMKIKQFAGNKVQQPLQCRSIFIFRWLAMPRNRGEKDTFIKSRSMHVVN